MANQIGRLSFQFSSSAYPEIKPRPQWTSLKGVFTFLFILVILFYKLLVSVPGFTREIKEFFAALTWTYPVALVIDARKRSRCLACSVSSPVLWKHLQFKTFWVHLISLFSPVLAWCNMVNSTVYFKSYVKCLSSFVKILVTREEQNVGSQKYDCWPKQNQRYQRGKCGMAMLSSWWAFRKMEEQIQKH